jgi:hypothetical protein
MKILTQAQKAVEEHPAKITAAEFHKMINENPAVFKHWETPLEITEYVNCKFSAITHLSPHLTFSGRNSNGASADFSECKHLKIATGTFGCLVAFSGSGIETIEDLHIKNVNTEGWAACFDNCKNLKVATGTYPGCVFFNGSGVNSIEKLHITGQDYNYGHANFKDCLNLQTLEGWDLSKKIKIEPEKLEAEKKRRASLKKFHKETKVEELPFL